MIAWDSCLNIASSRTLVPWIRAHRRQSESSDPQHQNRFLLSRTNDCPNDYITRVFLQDHIA
eukprot:4547511-Amphidinium_carterae.2